MLDQRQRRQATIILTLAQCIVFAEESWVKLAAETTTATESYQQSPTSDNLAQLILL